MAHMHLIKLSVGTEAVEDLAAWQSSRPGRGPDTLPRHVTRMWPKREAEIVQGGSIYWVIKGVIQCRQEIVRLDEVIGHDGVRRCGIVLRPELIRVTPAPKRPFQGWRYLKPEDAPQDMRAGREGDTPLPTDLARELADIGLL
jgi:hypothetical protein